MRVGRLRPGFSRGRRACLVNYSLDNLIMVTVRAGVGGTGFHGRGGSFLVAQPDYDLRPIAFRLFRCTSLRIDQDHNRCVIKPVKDRGRW